MARPGGCRDAATESREYANDGDLADTVAAVGLAVLPSPALALTALPHLDASIGAVPLPLHAGVVHTAAFA
ncbi:hypothetical protein [Micromonospora inyonensis]|uniref:Uncharacterized protein n=1 Tax=Micromonospora inyonensis TaxID=47866 RepID=A0A1C6RSE7_9ACTN|nr:hypothetical protein [Micromonospora inyonensis]SCL20134.1 hypothetical protein GA0074694_2935 [Micromonospora inyonensis]